jgi:hypothetical protein
MYIILNTAMSSNWGFEPPAGCNPCYDCGRSECSCACPTNLCDNFPAAFLIDYVRVYQDSTNPEQTVSCSPDSHPTAAYIKGNQPMYMNNPPLPGEVAPLIPVTTGGGVCYDRFGCGNGNSAMGSCSSGVCLCTAGYTGPTCLASVGFDDVSDILFFRNHFSVCEYLCCFRSFILIRTMILVPMEYRAQNCRIPLSHFLWRQSLVLYLWSPINTLMISD